MKESRPVYPGHDLFVVIKPNYTSTYKASAHITPTNSPLSEANHMAKSNINGMYTPPTMERHCNIT